MIDAENMPALATRIRDGLVFPWNRKTDENFTAWRSTVLPKVCEVIGFTGESIPRAEIIDSWNEEGYSGHQLAMHFSNGEVAAAYFLLPASDAPVPAVLLLHDHGAFFAIGKEKMIRRPTENAQTKEQSQGWVDRIYGGRHLGNELARRGYAVLTVDALGWGSRQGNGYEAQQALASNLMQLGASLAAVIAQEDAEALCYLANLPQVDPLRIATFGFSMGGFRAWQGFALSDHATACVSGGWMGEIQRLMQSGNNLLRGQSAFYTLHPAIAGKLDFPHFAALGAPKPALFFTGMEDRHFPPEVADAAFQQLHDIWKAAGAEEKLETRLYPAPHIFPVPLQEDTIQWLDAQLGR